MENPNVENSRHFEDKLPGLTPWAFDEKLQSTPPPEPHEWNALFDQIYEAKNMPHDPDPPACDENNPHDQALQVQKNARQKIVEQHLGIALSEAKRPGRWDIYDDLQQTAMAKLLEATDTFIRSHLDSKGAAMAKGYPGYVRNAIRYTLWKEIETHWNGTAIPGRLTAELRDFQNACESLTAELGRSPSLKEIGEEIDIDDSEKLFSLLTIYNNPHRPLPLEQIVSHDGISVFNLQQDAEVALSPEQQRADLLVERTLLLVSLRHAEILGLLYGLNGEPPLNYEEVREKLGLSQIRVSNILLTAKKEFKEVFEMLEKGTLDFTAWEETHTRLPGNVLFFLHRTNIPIPDLRLIDLRVIARRHLGELRDKKILDDRGYGIIQDLYGLDDGGNALFIQDVKKKWKIGWAPLKAIQAKTFG